MRRSFAALLGPAAPGDDFEAALRGSVPDAQPFSNSEQVLSLSPGFTETVFNAARTAAAAAVANLPALAPCFSAGISRACVSTLLGDFGLRAWRRPWTAEEVTSYLAFYDAVAAKSDPRKAVEYVLRRLLAAPDSLFRFEIGGAPDSAGVAALTPYEAASAIAYVITDGPPDATLMAAARQGALQARSSIEAEARRLLERPETAQTVPSFFDEYLDGERPTALPEQVEELKRFVEQALWRDAGKLSTLLTADYTFVNPVLAKHYGWTMTPTRGQAPAADWQQLKPPAAEGRSGLLTLGPFLSRRTNRSARGKFIKSAFLCSNVPNPPAEVDQSLDSQKTSLAARLGRPPTEEEAREAHMTNPTCAGCHRLIDPIGQPFLTFDRLGVWRAVNPETRKPYVTASLITDTGAIDGPVSDARAVTRALAGSAPAGECFARQVYEYVMGRAATETDTCRLRELGGRFSQSGGDVRQLFLDVIAGDGFRLRAAGRR